jgi:uncharacterized protein YebE (UPF0316 family)
MTGALRPLVIMVLVITEVGLWQWRVILTGRGAKGFPTVLGVVGAVLQITAIAQVVAYVRDPLTVAAYALGVGGGVLIGVIVGTRFTPEAVSVSVLTRQPRLDGQLQDRGWPVTSYEGHSATGTVHLLQIVVDPRSCGALLADVTELAPQAFWTTEKVQSGPSRPRPAERFSTRPTLHRRLTTVTVGQA